jgi:hypothetical protein
MSYTIPTDYYWNPGKPAYGPGFDEPVPGWGFRPNMVGPRRVGVGAFGTVVDSPASTPSQTKVGMANPWPQFVLFVGGVFALGALAGYALKGKS